jgi:hypothetical protein
MYSHIFGDKSKIFLLIFGFLEAVAKLHGSGKSMILGHLAQDRLSLSIRAAGGLPKGLRRHEKILWLRRHGEGPEDLRNAKQVSE